MQVVYGIGEILMKFYQMLRTTDTPLGMSWFALLRAFAMGSLVVSFFIAVSQISRLDSARSFLRDYNDNRNYGRYRGKTYDK